MSAFAPSFPRSTQHLRGDAHAVVFDKARSLSPHMEQRLGFRIGAHKSTDIFGHFRNRDERSPKVNVTHILCGDPAPGRPMPQEELTVAPGRVCTESGPVLLTFRELEAAKKLQIEGVSL